MTIKVEDTVNTTLGKENDKGQEEEEQSQSVKKRKIDESVNNNNQDETNDKCISYLLLSDLESLTDYFILLFSQVTLGIMNESDLQRAKKIRPCDQIGFRGICCRHCHLVATSSRTTMLKGKYFPSCAKNLCATPPTLHSHLLSCPNVPDEIKRALKLTKSRHKYAALTKPMGSQSVFFRNLWERIQSTTFGDDNDASGLATIQTEIDFIIEQSKPTRPKIGKMMQTRALTIPTAPASQHDSAMMMMEEQSVGMSQVELPNVVSYDLDIDANYTFAAQALDVELKEETTTTATTRTASPTEEDFEIVLDLLLQPETPDNDPSRSLRHTPRTAFAMTPAAVVPGPGLLSPIPTRVNEFGERYHNGEFVISSTYDASNFCKEDGGTEEEEKYETNQGYEDDGKQEYITTPRSSNNVNKTRKFTRNDEILLIRGILKHGKSQWKKIWQNTRELQHIKHSALKDRARSKRFKTILERAQNDETLLEQPEILCGSEDSPAYHTPRASTPLQRRSPAPSSNGSRTGSDPFSSCGPLRRR